MQQKIMSMRYLITIGSFLLILFFNNCGQTDYLARSKWIYINETEYEIFFVRDSSEWSKFNLKPFETKTFEEENEGGKEVKPENFIPLVRPFIIWYGNFLCDTLFITSSREGDGPCGISNYSNRKLEKRYYEFTYRFTLSDVAKADTCK